MSEKKNEAKEEEWRRGERWVGRGTVKKKQIRRMAGSEEEEESIKNHSSYRTILMGEILSDR